MLNCRQNRRYKSLSFFKNLSSKFGQRFVVYFKRIKVESSVFSKIFEQSISLLKRFLVLNQRKKIIRIGLRNHGIKKFSSAFAAIRNEVRIVRRNHHTGQKTNVVGNSFVGFIIFFNDFFTFFWQLHFDDIIFFFSLNFCFYRKKIAFV